MKDLSPMWGGTSLAAQVETDWERTIPGQIPDLQKGGIREGAVLCRKPYCWASTAARWSA